MRGEGLLNLESGVFLTRASSLCTCTPEGLAPGGRGWAGREELTPPASWLEGRGAEAHSAAAER